MQRSPEHLLGAFSAAVCRCVSTAGLFFPVPGLTGRGLLLWEGGPVLHRSGVEVDTDTSADLMEIIICMHMYMHSAYC